MGDPELRRAVIARYREQRQVFQSILEDLLREHAPLTLDNIDELEELLIVEEVRLGSELALSLHELKPYPEEQFPFVHQLGATCMSTSMANAMIALEEPFFQDDVVSRVHAFTDHVVSHTNSFGKPHEYRSVDDMHKYLKRGDHLGFSKRSKVAMERRYRCELTNSLFDVLVAFHSGRGRVITQQSAHAQMAYGLEIREQDEGSPEILVRQRDPFTSHGSDRHATIELLEWRHRYLWSPLKKLPTTMGHGFESLDADEALAHLARYEEMDNLGVECSSALLVALSV